MDHTHSFGEVKHIHIRPRLPEQKEETLIIRFHSDNKAQSIEQMETNESRQPLLSSAHVCGFVPERSFFFFFLFLHMQAQRSVVAIWSIKPFVFTLDCIDKSHQLL